MNSANSAAWASLSALLEKGAISYRQQIRGPKYQTKVTFRIKLTRCRWSPKMAVLVGGGSRDNPETSPQDQRAGEREAVTKRIASATRLLNTIG
jgi:hypothetical protein